MRPMELPAALQGRDIVCVGFADWDTELWTNQHHLMARLARENRVLFVESLGLRRPQLAGRDLRADRAPAARGPAGPAPARRSDVLSPLVLPLHGNRAAEALNARLLPALVSPRRPQDRDARTLLWSYVPQAEALLDALEPSLVVYHCVDDISAHARIDTASFRAAEARFAAPRRPRARERARRWRAACAALGQRARRAERRRHRAVRDALDPGPPDPAIAALPAPRLVFTGAISAVKLDIPLLVELARARPDWSLALVGPVGLGDPTTDVSALRPSPTSTCSGRAATRSSRRSCAPPTRG